MPSLSPSPCYVFLAFDLRPSDENWSWTIIGIVCLVLIPSTTWRLPSSPSIVGGQQPEAMTHGQNRSGF